MSSRSCFRLILSICDDARLRSSRESLLRRAGYEVHSFSSMDRPGKSLVRCSHLAIICDSVAWRRAAEVCEDLQFYNPAIRCLDLARESGGEPQGRTKLAGVEFLEVVRGVVASGGGRADPAKPCP